MNLSHSEKITILQSFFRHPRLIITKYFWLLVKISATPELFHVFCDSHLVSAM